MYVGLSQQLAREFRKKIETGAWPVGRRLPTTRELAAAYDVSVNTIQNAFRELEAHDLVVRHPRRGGYVKPANGHGNGRNGRGNRSGAHTVGVVSPQGSLDSPRESHTWNWNYWIIRAAEHELGHGDHHVSLLTVPAAAPEAEARDVLPRVARVADDLAGLILFPHLRGLDKLTEELDRLDVPWVTINKLTPRATHNFVVAENFEGGRTVGRCFARLGYGRVVVLGHALMPGSSIMDKFFGFLHGWMEEGKATSAVEYVACESFVEQAGYDALARHVDRAGGTPPDGVFAGGDLMALGAIRLCRDRGWAVPGQVGVVGATGLEVAQYAHPTLSVLAQPMKQMGIEAARMLLRMNAQGVNRCEGRYIGSPLILRESFNVPPDTLREMGVTIGG